MAKSKKSIDIVKSAMEFEPERISDNHEPGVADLPNGGWKGYDYENQMFFPGQIAAGESPFAPHVHLENANGTVCSCGRDSNSADNYWGKASGKWNQNQGWNGNKSGE
jgi:hypothetical protein